MLNSCLFRSATNSANPTKKKSKDDENRVVDLHRLLVSIVASLLNSTCSNLRSYSVKMLECHRERWIGKLEKLLEEDLQVLQFPQCILDIEQVTAIITNRSDSWLNNKWYLYHHIYVVIFQTIKKSMCSTYLCLFMKI